MPRTAPVSDNTPTAMGAYSPSVAIEGVIAVSGQCGYRADRSLPESIEEQMTLAFGRLRDALSDSGADLDDVLSVTVYLRDQQDFLAMDSYYGQFFSAPYPARTTVAAGLRQGVRFEISAFAVRPSA